MKGTNIAEGYLGDGWIGWMPLGSRTREDTVSVCICAKLAVMDVV